MKKMFMCSMCSSVEERRGTNQLYCLSCSADVEAERQRVWARENGKPRPPSRASPDARADVASGLSSESLGIGWTCQPELVWEVRVSIPFSYGMSKNRLYHNGARGNKVLTAAARSHRDSLTNAVKAACSKQKVASNKLWVSMLVQKPDNRGDAVNMIDIVCDAIKRAIPLDDRWYSIRGVDWQIVKSDPRIYVGIGQESLEDVLVCSCCGRSLPIEAFSKKKSSMTGRDRDCRECKSALRRADRHGSPWKDDDKDRPRVEVEVQEVGPPAP